MSATIIRFPGSAPAEPTYRVIRLSPCGPVVIAEGSSRGAVIAEILMDGRATPYRDPPDELEPEHSQ